MKKLIDHARHLNALRKLLGWEMLGQAVGSRLKFEVVGSPPAGKALVLAPHPGDDVLAVGGALARHHDAGDEIRIIYLCDGRNGTKRPVTEIVRDELKKTRRAEAVAATAVLGISPGKLTFWAYHDGALAVNKTTTKALTQALADYLPTVIYVPHPADRETDHRATASLLAASLHAMGGDLPAEIWSYELWQPTFANRLLDINAVMNQKLAAIDAHASQLKCRAYDEAVSGLNRYRGALAGLPGPAEGYLAMRPALYLKLWTLLRELA